MKAKRFLSLALSLALAASVSVPAFAAEGRFTVNGEPVPTISAGADPADYIILDAAGAPLAPAPAEETGLYLSRDEFLMEYVEERPEYYESFDADAYFQQEYGIYDWTKEEYQGFMELETEEDFKQAMWQEWLVTGIILGDSLYDEIDAAYDAYLLDLYESRHPGELESLRTEDLLADQGYTETLTPAEQFMKGWDLEDESEVRSVLLRNYALHRLAVDQTHADFLEYQAAWPEKWAEFDADAWFAEGYAWYDSKEAYMSDWTILTEEEFREDMFVNCAESNYWYWTEGDGGWYDPWGDGEEKPLTLVVNGAAMPEADVAAEGGVSYASVSTLNAVFGQNNFDDGTRKPIRAAAQAMGWDVGWNRRSNTVFLLDGETLKAQYAESMAALDAALTWALEHADRKEGQSYQATAAVDVTLTMLDSLDGDRDYTFRVTVETLQRDGVIELTAAVNAADLLSLLGDDLVSAVAAQLPQLTAQDWKTLLGGLELNAILDLEKGNFYVNVPAAVLFNEALDPDTWYGASLGMGVNDALRAETGKTVEEMLDDLPAVLAEVLYQDLLEKSADSWTGPQEVFAENAEAVAILTAVAGPDTLKKSGTTLTWSVDTETVNAAFAQMAGTAAAPFQSYELKYVMKDDGSFTYDASVRPDMEGMASAMYAGDDYYYGSDLWSILGARMMSLFDFRMEGHSAGTADKAAGTVVYHQKNAFKLKLDTQAVRKEVKTAPAAQPPAGATVVKL